MYGLFTSVISRNAGALHFWGEVQVYAKGRAACSCRSLLPLGGFNKVILHVVPWTNISPLCYLEMFFIPSYSMNPVFPHHLLVRKLIKRTFLSIFITATFLGAIGKAAAWWHFGVWFKKMFVNSIPAKRKHFSGIIIFLLKQSAKQRLHTTKI